VSPCRSNEIQFCPVFPITYYNNQQQQNNRNKNATCELSVLESVEFTALRLTYLNRLMAGYTQVNKQIHTVLSISDNVSTAETKELKKWYAYF
jgi:hypothetical protein